jgi:hypothetical protein
MTYIQLHRLGKPAWPAKSLHRIILTLAIAVLAACELTYEGSLADRIAQAARGQSEIDLTQIVRSEWTRMLIFSPYTSEDLAVSEVGESWPGFQSSGIERRDDICLLVFVNRSKVVDSATIKRSVVDFSSAAKKGGYPRADSRFVIADGKALPMPQLSK